MFEQGLITEISLTPEVAKSVTQELKPFFDKVEGTSHLEANLETKERLELRPRVEGSDVPAPALGAGAGEEAAKPLTREELMSALGGKRTMAADIEALRQKRETDKADTTPPQMNPS
jgi:hypothetical protein